MAKIKAVNEKSDSQNTDGAAGRSGIASPYFDLDSSITVAKMVYETGGGACSLDQLAAWLVYKTTKSGTFMTRMAAANKHFGLIETSSDRIVVTERAKNILSPVMPEDAVRAKVEAFLAVPLFAKVFEQFKGNQLPPEIGLKNLFLNTYKVLPDRVNQALRVFLNSAEQAGFFKTTGDRTRLIPPSVASVNATTTKPNDNLPPKEPPSATTDITPKHGGGGGDGGAGGVDTAIIGLLRKLPTQGSSWTSAEQARFLAAFTHTVQFLYPTANDGVKE